MNFVISVVSREATKDELAQAVQTLLKLANDLRPEAIDFYAMAARDAAAIREYRAAQAATKSIPTQSA